MKAHAADPNAQAPGVRSQRQCQTEGITLLPRPTLAQLYSSNPTCRWPAYGGWISGAKNEVFGYNRIE